VHEGYLDKTPPLFNYTGKTVVGLKAWGKAKKARVKTLAGVWGNTYGSGLPGAVARNLGGGA
jgi:hypothetical protein